MLGQLFREACFARRGDGGHRLVEAQGFLGAAFRHRTSRAGDPQLHTHVVVPNLVQGSDGIWSAPDGRHLFVWAKTAGTLYQAALRAELAPLGLGWNVRRSGLGELAGIPKAILQAFSTRRADIEAAMEARGSDSIAPPGRSPWRPVPVTTGPPLWSTSSVSGGGSAWRPYSSLTEPGAAVPPRSRTLGRHRPGAVGSARGRGR